MISRELRGELAMAVNDYIASSADVYERIYKINDPFLAYKVSKEIGNADLVEDIEDVWNSMRKSVFN